MNENASPDIVCSAEQLDQLKLDNPFWQFSLQQWKNPELQKVLLELQDTQNFKINHLLFAMWLGLEGKELKAHAKLITRETEFWHKKIVDPLRTLRKSLPKHAIRARVQAAELDAEQIEQALLYGVSIKLPEAKQNNTVLTLRDNLFASRLPESHLLLFIQACLPAYSEQALLAELK